MRSAEAATESRDETRLDWKAIVVALLLAGYGYLLCDMACFSAGGSDSSGYLNSARLLTEGKLADSVEPLTRFGLPQRDIRVFIPLGFSPGARPGTMVPSYPPGLPLQMALAALLGGWARAPFWISPLSAVASVILIYAVARELGLTRASAAGASVILAAFPTLIFFGLQPMSDVPATAWALASALAALISRRRPNAAFLCGAALGVAVLVRPTNALLAIPLAFALPARRRLYLRALLGGIGFLILLLGYFWVCNGSPWVSGYGPLRGSFSFARFPARAWHYLYWLGALATPLLPIGWIAVARVGQVPGRDRAFLVLWFAVFFLFYSGYDPYSTWWYTRFLLPALPAMILATLLVAERGFVRPAESRA
jgi:4-amino-4-deoxy-L-arabinose transferase-like glycosyltransferase